LVRDSLTSFFLRSRDRGIFLWVRSRDNPEDAERHGLKEAVLYGADPKDKHPMKGFPQVCFIQNTVSNPNIIIGDYTYYDDPEDSENFERNVLYHFPFIGDRLIIGKFCALAKGVKFIMNGANHKLDGFSTYPFGIFGNGWERIRPQLEELPYKGDTVVENDVWIGYEAVIMPGVQIGNGAIVAAKSVVVSDVPPYTIYGGNPAKLIRQRFDDAVIRSLLAIAWWNWDIEKITRNLEKIVAADIDALMQCE
jgi:virginiamycin A acetyltransferase